MCVGEVGLSTLGSHFFLETLQPNRLVLAFIFNGLTKTFFLPFIPHAKLNECAFSFSAVSYKERTRGLEQFREFTGAAIARKFKALS